MTHTEQPPDRTDTAWIPWAASRWSGCVLMLLAVQACSLLNDPTASAPRCVLAEDAADPCPGMLRCLEGRCVKPPPCEEGQCADGQVCVEGVCISASTPCEEGECADGQVCVEGVCISASTPACSPETETCDQRDNDCDGVTDEGHDTDEDGVRWCGDGSRGSGDCDDLDPGVAPGLPEACDGLDNDCDGQTDESLEDDVGLCPDGKACIERQCVNPDNCLFAGCADGFRCEASTEGEAVCVAVTSSCLAEAGGQGCPTGQRCDASGACVPSDLTDGSPCVADADCASGACIDSAAMAMIGAAERVCGRACCHDSDCSDDQRCLHSGTGARTCVTQNLLTSGPPAACRNSADCGDEANCAITGGLPLSGENFVERTDLFAAICGEPRGAPDGSFCANFSSCASGVCLANFFSFGFGSCVPTCGTSADCETFGMENSEDSYCRYLPFPERGTTDDSSTDYASLCVESPGGTLRTGESCETGSACADGACLQIEGAGKCADICCTDADCAAGGVGVKCRPVAFGENRYEMRCLP